MTWLLTYWKKRDVHYLLSSLGAWIMLSMDYISHNLTVSEVVKSKVGQLYETVYCRDNVYRVNGPQTGVGL